MSQREKLLLAAVLFAALLIIIPMSTFFIENNQRGNIEEAKSAQLKLRSKSETQSAEAAAGDAFSPFDDSMDEFNKFATQTAEAARDEFSTPDPMDALLMYATQTGEAIHSTPIPTATLLPDIKYWNPLSADGFAVRLTYNSKQWAETDIRTLASLQISGCALRLAGGRALGPGWTTEKATFQTDTKKLFSTILAKHKGVPQFITYSLPNGVVFEIASESDFAQCQQSGEAVLKTITIQ